MQYSHAPLLHDAAYNAADVASLAYRDVVTGRPVRRYDNLPQYDPNKDLSFSTAMSFPNLQMPEQRIVDFHDHLSSSDESEASEASDGEED